MPLNFRQALSLGLIILLLLATAACASRTQPVRHLAADVSMIAQGDSERNVMAMIGPPDIRRALTDGGEEWLYLEHRQSRLRQTRVLGNWMGHEDYHLAVITLHNGQVSQVIYRALTAEEFLEYGDQLPDRRP